MVKIVQMDKGDKVEYAGERYMKKDYRSYEHFAAVIGKFNPYTFFLAKPIQTKNLTRALLEKVWIKIQKLN